MNHTAIPIILQIEDSEADIEYTQEACGESGCVAAFTVIRDGAAALDFVDAVVDGRESPPDLVLLDLNLPKVPGHAVLEKMRRHQEFAKIPIIVLTSTASSVERNRSMQLGATTHLVKPVGFAATMKLIRDLQSYLPQ